MKSEKARQELDDGSWKVEINCEGKELDDPYRTVGVDVAEYAVELADQAENRMREKAIEAHRKVCFFRNLKDNTCANTATQCGEHSCYYMNNFIQKLTEQ